MNLSVRSTGAWQHALDIEVPAEEVERRLDDAARQIQRRASLPGFRKGRVPLDLVRQHFAEHVEAEFQDSFVPQLVNEAMDEARLSPVVPPLVRIPQFLPKAPLKLEVVVDVKPEVEVKHYRGLKAVRHLIDYAAFRRSPEQRAVTFAAVAPLPHARVLTEVQSKEILGAAGLPVTREALARDSAEAMRLAAEIGGAVALKIQSRDIPHKSDIGGVHLNARTAAEVEAAASKVLKNARRNCPDATIDGILVQEMVEDGVEFILGMTYDETFGPLVVCGAGGVTVEVFKDAAVLLPPFMAEEARAAIASLKVATLLDGFRGAPPRDLDALVDCCVRFGDFVAATDGQYAAIDLNPVLVCARGRGVRIADALMETRGGDA